MSNKYTKEQLLEKDVQELQTIIREMKLSREDDETKEKLVYKILDAQAEVLSAESEVAPKRRRIVAKAPDHVYSATQTGNSERFDTPKEERAAKRLVAAKAKAADAMATQALLGTETPAASTTKKKRTRSAKEEQIAPQESEELKTRQARPKEQARKAQQDQVETIMPEETLEKENAANDIATDAAPTDVASPNAVSGNDGLPDFIVEQIRQQKNEEDTEHHAGQTEEAVGLEDLTEHFRQKQAELSEDNAEMAEAETIVETKETSVENDFEEGVKTDFIIVDDIPVVDVNDFAADVSVEDEYNSASNYPHENVSVNKFRRFKEDVLVNPRLQERRVETATAHHVPEPPMQDIVIDGGGVLEVDNQGVGFLRSADYNYMPSPDDVYVSQNQIRSHALKMGDVIEGKIKIPREGEKYFTLVEIQRINGLAPHEVRDRVAFEHLTPLFPDEQFKLSNNGASPLACRIVDLFSPIGKGQRSLIVAQPKTGKTILLKQIANAIAANYPDTYLMMLLIDERPEEVTDMARTVNAEVIASTFDEPAARHVRIAQMVLEKAKRMVECGHDVVIFLDSITRLARAFNTVAPASGKILTGGVDANALQKPKRFFGAARNIENGGSLTIIATALIDTGSKMDEVIFEEFKGTGNMELQLDRSLANKRIFPAVNLIQSSTRRDDLLLNETTLNRMYILRNYMADMSSMEAMEFVKKRLENSISNEEFLMTMNK